LRQNRGFEVRLAQGTVEVNVTLAGYEPASVSGVDVTPDLETEVTLALVAQDLDTDNLADPWELTNFGDLAQGPAGDFDNDGLPNDFEFVHGFDPDLDDADDDIDGDGFSNLEEFKGGTDQNDPSSVPNRSLPWIQLLLE
jgi:hypothetical protein